MDFEQTDANDIFGELNFTFTEIQHKRSTLEWTSIGAFILASISLALHLIAFILIPELRKHSGKYLVSLCVAFLVDFILTIISNFITAGIYECRYLAYVTYYFSLVPHLWIGIIGFTMWKNLREALTTVTFTSGKQGNRFFYCSLLAWLLPGLAVIVVLVNDQMEPTSVPTCFVPNLGSYVCWFGEWCSLILFYHGPIISYVSVSILFLILSGLTMLTCNESGEATLAVASKRIMLKSFAVLTILAYATRIVELMTVFLDDVAYLHYGSMIFTSSLGIYFFVAFTCTGNARFAVIEYLSKGSEKGTVSQSSPIDTPNYRSLPQSSEEAEMEVKPLSEP